MILKDRLTTHWQDFDGALFDLAVVLGIVKEDVEPYPRWLFISNNPIAVALDRILFELVDIGAIELNDDHQYRWNDNFNFNKQEVIKPIEPKEDYTSYTDSEIEHAHIFPLVPRKPLPNLDPV